MKDYKSILLLAALTGVATSILCFSSPANAQRRAALCTQYANEALKQYQLTIDNRKCRVNGDGRWQSNYQNHYKWCQTAPIEWIHSEEAARNAYLYQCGARARFAEPVLNPVD